MVWHLIRNSQAHFQACNRARLWNAIMWSPFFADWRLQFKWTWLCWYHVHLCVHVHSYQPAAHHHQSVCFNSKTNVLLLLYTILRTSACKNRLVSLIGVCEHKLMIHTYVNSCNGVITRLSCSSRNCQGLWKSFGYQQACLLWLRLSAVVVLLLPASSRRFAVRWWDQRENCKFTTEI